MSGKKKTKSKPVSHLHFVGIGGIGMSAVAQIMKAGGYNVTGSDSGTSATIDILESRDIKVYREHKKENVAGADVLVISSAISKSNPEIQAAQRKGIPIWHRAEALGKVLNDRTGIVVTGTHGKTTITGMISFLFKHAGLDPTCLVGGILDEFGSNALIGASEWVIAEGDESDGSFRHLHPKFAIVNNIEEDHLDYFKGIDDIHTAFKSFLEAMPDNGEIWMSADCPGAQSVRAELKRSVRTYGEAEEADLRFTDYTKEPSESRAQILLNGSHLGELKLSIAGRFNMHNALAAIAAGFNAGVSFDEIAAILAEFQGTKRRLELKGRAKGITVLDDYAHHPTEIRATVGALCERYRGRRVGVFQPHRYSRTERLGNQFSSAFEELDLLVLTDIYGAGERPIEGVDGETLFRATRRNHREVVYVPRLEEIPEYLLDVLREGDVLITMGAGNVWQVGEETLDRLHGGLQTRRE